MSNKSNKSNRSNQSPPEGLRKIVEALVARALIRCDRLGIAHEDFYRALVEEQQSHPPTNATDLIRRAFNRLRAAGVA